jgi:hypothetical protein
MEKRGRAVRGWASALALLIIAIVGLKGAWGQEPSDRISYQGVTIQPGDVINWHKGMFTTGAFLAYGHTSLYLGRDEKTKEPTFLDFSPPAHMAPFLGPIVPEREFLAYNAKNHPSFDVFRLKQNFLLKKEILFEEARRIAAGMPVYGVDETCVTAVARCLSKAAEAAGIRIRANLFTTPDDLASQPDFQRHPDLVGKTIIIEAALQDAEARSPASTEGAKAALSVPRAVEQAFRAQVDFMQTKAAQLGRRLADQQALKARAEEGTKARDPKIAEANRQAVVVLGQAIEMTQKALELAKSVVKKFSHIGEVYRKTWVRGEHVRIVATGGTVTWSSGVRGAIRPGEAVSTGRDGHVSLVTDSGAVYNIGPDTTVMLEKPPRPVLGTTPPPKPDEIYYQEELSPVLRLMQGKLHAFELKIKEELEKFRRRVEVRTPAFAMTVRGTEFDLEAEGSGLSHLVPFDGIVQIAAEGELDPTKIDRWWDVTGKEARAAEQSEGEAPKVVYVHGDVKVQREKDAPREVMAPYALQRGEKLTTGKGALVHMVAQKGLTETLGENTVLELSAKEEGGQQVYLLREGLLHLAAHGLQAGAKPVVLTPNAVITGSDFELDLMVSDNKVTRVTPYSGRVIVEASMKWLDETAIGRWWDEVHE